MPRWARDPHAHRRLVPDVDGMQRGWRARHSSWCRQPGARITLACQEHGLQTIVDPFERDARHRRRVTGEGVRGSRVDAQFDLHPSSDESRRHREVVVQKHIVCTDDDKDRRKAAQVGEDPNSTMFRHAGTSEPSTFSSTGRPGGFTGALVADRTSHVPQRSARLRCESSSRPASELCQRSEARTT